MRSLHTSLEYLRYTPPDIAPSDFHLFRSMQHVLEDTHFHNFEDVLEFVENYINSRKEFFYRCEIHLLPK